MKSFLLVLSAVFCLNAANSHPGVGIVMDSKGNVFYTDLSHIWKIDVQGRKSVAVRNVHSHEIYLDENDNLFGEHLWYEGEATDKWGHFVWILSSSGKFDKIIPDTEGFLNNYSFVRDHHGNMYWVNRDHNCQNLSKKSNSGTVTTHGNGCLNNVRFMTATGDGTIFLMDQFDLKRVDSQGRVKNSRKATSGKKTHTVCRERSTSRHGCLDG